MVHGTIWASPPTQRGEQCRRRFFAALRMTLHKKKSRKPSPCSGGCAAPKPSPRRWFPLFDTEQSPRKPSPRRGRWRGFMPRRMRWKNEGLYSILLVLRNNANVRNHNIVKTYRFLDTSSASLRSAPFSPEDGPLLSAAPTFPPRAGESPQGEGLQSGYAC